MKNTHTKQLRLCIAIIVSLALPGVAHAQSTTTIGFQDAALDAMPPAANAWGDIIGGTLVLADDGTSLIATLMLNALPEIQPGMAYIFVFSDGESEWFAGAITAPTLSYLYGPWAGDDNGPSGMSSTSGAYTTGPSGTIRIDFPIAALGNATKVMTPRGLTGDIKPGASPAPLPLPQVVYLDLAQGEGELELPARPSLGDPSSPASTPASNGTATAAATTAGSSAPATTTPTPDEAAIPAPGLVATLGALGLLAIVARSRRGG